MIQLFLCTTAVLGDSRTFLKPHSSESPCGSPQNPIRRWAGIWVSLTILDVHAAAYVHYTCIFGGFFLYWLYVRNDFPSGQVGEAGACKAGGESHFGQGCGCLLRTYLLDIPKFMFKLLCLVQSGVGQGPSVARGKG